MVPPGWFFTCVLPFPFYYHVYYVYLLRFTVYRYYVAVGGWTTVTYDYLPFRVGIIPLPYVRFTVATLRRYVLPLLLPSLPFITTVTLQIFRLVPVGVTCHHHCYLTFVPAISHHTFVSSFCSVCIPVVFVGDLHHTPRYHCHTYGWNCTFYTVSFWNVSAWLPYYYFWYHHRRLRYYHVRTFLLPFVSTTDEHRCSTWVDFLRSTTDSRRCSVVTFYYLTILQSTFWVFVHTQICSFTILHMNTFILGDFRYCSVLPFVTTTPPLHSFPVSHFHVVFWYRYYIFLILLPLWYRFVYHVCSRLRYHWATDFCDCYRYRCSFRIHGHLLFYVALMHSHRSVLVISTRHCVTYRCSAAPLHATCSAAFLPHYRCSFSSPRDCSVFCVCCSATPATDHT